MGRDNRELLFSRPVASGAAVVIVLTVLGCMSLSFGGKTYECHSGEGHCGDDSYVQSGAAHLHGSAEQDVYYPVAYASPPNVELSGDDADDCEIVEQKPEHFRIHNNSLWSADVEWKARGVRQPPALAPVPAGTTPPPPTDGTTLPSQPTPAP
jgi:hypothetical protein